MHGVLTALLKDLSALSFPLLGHLLLPCVVFCSVVLRSNLVPLSEGNKCVFLVLWQTNIIITLDVSGLVNKLPCHQSVCYVAVADRLWIFSVIFTLHKSVKSKIHCQEFKDKVFW